MRTLAGLLTLGVCFWKGCDALSVVLSDKDCWKSTIIGLVALTASLLVQTPVMAVSGFRMRAFIRDRLGFVAEWEKTMDPDRTSSGLRQDGTDPPRRVNP